MPKLWDETIDGHRQAVRDATLDAAASLVEEHGLTAVTMSQVAGRAGIGRATLYKYFPDIESILLAWHERQIGNHLEKLATISDPAQSAGSRLEAVLQFYALILNAHPSGERMAALHQGAHVIRAQRRLSDFIQDLMTEAAEEGALRDDISPAELTNYSLHALAAAGSLESKAAVRRLVAITLAGLKPVSANPHR